MAPRFKKVLMSSAGLALLAVALLLGNYVISFLPLRWDATEGNVYTLGEGTRSLVKSIPDTMVVRVMFSSELPPQMKLNEQYVRDLLAEYKQASGGKIRLEYFDPSKSDKAKQEAMTSGVMPVQLEVMKRDRREVQESFMGLVIIYGDQKEPISFIADVRGLEYEITLRIKKLIQPHQTTIGIVTNGSALTFDSEPLRSLKDPLGQQYQFVDVDLSSPIPTNVKSIWLLAPTTKLSAAQVSRLESFLSNGGTAGILLDQYSVSIAQFRLTPADSGLDEVLKKWGVEVKRGVVVDARCDRIRVQTTQGMYSRILVLDYPFFPLAADLDRDHPATKNIDAVSLPFVSPIVSVGDVPGLKQTPLARSSRISWLDTQGANVSPLQEHMKPEGAEVGPFNLAMLLEGDFDASDPTNANGRVILFGCSRWIRTDFPPRDSNFALFFNLLDWSVQDEFLTSIRSKGIRIRPIKELSDGKRMVVKYILMLGLPLLTAILGLLLWARHKRRMALLPLLYKDL
jgi:gliding-associated putative ABC transporter substrate-binding component GldG